MVIKELRRLGYCISRTTTARVDQLEDLLKRMDQ
jgi:hypothetical protein